MILHPLIGFAPTRGRPWNIQQVQTDENMSPDTRRQLSNYLRSGSLVIAWMEQTSDKLGAAFTVPGGSGIVTDGFYYWRLDAAWYVEYYGAVLSEATLQHFRSMDWEPTPLTADEILSAEKQLEELGVG